MIWFEKTETEVLRTSQAIQNSDPANPFSSCFDTVNACCKQEQHNYMEASGHKLMFKFYDVYAIRQGYGDDNVKQSRSPLIRNRVIPLSHYIANHRHRRVTHHRGNGAARVSGYRNQEVVCCNGDKNSDKSNNRSEIGPVRYLEPYRKIVLHAEEQVGEKEHRNNLKPFPV